MTALETFLDERILEIGEIITIEEWYGMTKTPRRSTNHE